MRKAQSIILTPECYMADSLKVQEAMSIFTDSAYYERQELIAYYDLLSAIAGHQFDFGPNFISISILKHHLKMLSKELKLAIHNFFFAKNEEEIQNTNAYLDNETIVKRGIWAMRVMEKEYFEYSH